MLVKEKDMLDVGCFAVLTVLTVLVSFAQMKIKLGEMYRLWQPQDEAAS